MSENAPQPTVLIATDLGPASHSVVDFGLRWAALIDAKVRLLHASSPPPETGLYPGAEPVGAYYQLAEAALKDAQERHRAKLEELRVDAGARGVPCETVCARGVAWRSILEEAVDAAYVVVGTHTPNVGDVLERSVRTRIFGSTAERVLRKAEAPVWIVPSATTPPSDKPFAHWLFATDLGHASLDAIERVADAVVTSGGRASVMHVVDDTGLHGANDEDWKRGVRDAIAEAADGALLCASAKLQHADRIVRMMSHARTHELILDEASARDASVLVLAARGHTGLERITIGSTSERCARGTAIPLLVWRQ